MKQRAKVQGQMASERNSTKHIKKIRANIYLSQTIKKIEEDITLPDSFYQAGITLIPKPEKDTTRI